MKRYTDFFSSGVAYICILAGAVAHTIYFDPSSGRLSERSVHYQLFSVTGLALLTFVMLCLFLWQRSIRVNQIEAVRSLSKTELLLEQVKNIGTSNSTSVKLEMFRHTLVNIPAVLVALDEKLNVVVYSHDAKEYYGDPMFEGAYFPDCLTPELRQVYVPALTESLQSEKTHPVCQLNQNTFLAMRSYSMAGRKFLIGVSVTKGSQNVNQE